MDLNFKKIELSDKKIIDFYFTSYHPKISEYTFTNLFIWSDIRQIRWSKLLDGIVFIGEKDNETYFLPPIGVTHCEKAFDNLIDYAIKNNVTTISLVPEYQIKFVKNKHLKIIPDRDNFDYIYKAEKLAFLKGWRLDGKRGFIKKFKENYNFTYRRFQIENKKSCIELFEKWLINKTNLPLANDEYKTFLKFMENFEYFNNAKGGIIEVDNKLVAFEFGEPLDINTFVIHYEKADTSYIGSFQIINQQFVENEIYPNYKFVNREQDMGVEGLRKAKLSYAPFKLIKKYEIKIT